MGVIDNIQVLIGKKKISDLDGTTLPHKKLLIVEDEPILREMYKDKFKLEGFDVITAENGQTGLDQVITHNPDIMLLDLMMPVMDGETMLRKLRDMPDFKGMPVLVLTNAGEIENIRHTKLFYDAIEFMIKSNVSLEEIVMNVKRRL